MCAFCAGKNDDDKLRELLLMWKAGLPFPADEEIRLMHIVRSYCPECSCSCASWLYFFLFRQGADSTKAA